MKLILAPRAVLLTVILTFLFAFSSCTKDSDKTKTEKTGDDLTTASEFTETNEDLLYC